VRIAITAGPWSSEVFTTLFPKAITKLTVSSLAGHSLILQSPRWKSVGALSRAVFVSDSVEGFTPEIFGRSGDEIYFAGLNSTEMPLPMLATNAKPDLAAIEVLKRASNRLLALPGGPSDLKIIQSGLVSY
jgi:hypothetical protein